MALAIDTEGKLISEPTPRNQPQPRPKDKGDQYDKSITQLKRALRQTKAGPRRRDLRTKLHTAQNFRQDGRAFTFGDDWSPIPLTKPNPAFQRSGTGVSSGTRTSFRGRPDVPMPKPPTTTEKLNKILETAPDLPPDVALALSGAKMTPQQLQKAAGIFMEEFGVDKLLLGPQGWRLKTEGTTDFWLNRQTGQRMTTRQADQLLMRNSSTWVPAFSASIRGSLTQLNFKQWKAMTGAVFNESGDRMAGQREAEFWQNQHAKYQKAINQLKPADVLVWVRYLMADSEIKNLTSFQEVAGMATMLSLYDRDTQMKFIKNFKTLEKDTSITSAFERIGTALGYASAGYVFNNLDEYVMGLQTDVDQASYVSAATIVKTNENLTYEQVQWGAREVDQDAPREEAIEAMGWNVLYKALPEAEGRMNEAAEAANMTPYEFQQANPGWVRTYLLEVLAEQAAEAGDGRLPGAREKMISDFIKGFSSNYRTLAKSLTISGSKEFEKLDASFGMDQTILGMALEDVGDRWRGAADVLYNGVNSIPGGNVLWRGWALANEVSMLPAKASWTALTFASEHGTDVVASGLYSWGSFIGNSLAAGADLLDGTRDYDWGADMLADLNHSGNIMLNRESLGDVLQGQGAPAPLAFSTDMMVAIFLDPTNILFGGVAMKAMARTEGGLAMVAKRAAAPGAKWADTAGIGTWARVKAGVRYAENRSALVDAYWNWVLPRGVDSKQLRAAMNLGDDAVGALGFGMKSVETMASDYHIWQARMGAQVYGQRAHNWLGQTMTFLGRKTPVQYIVEKARTAASREDGGSYFFEASMRMFRNRVTSGGLPRRFTDNLFDTVVGMDRMRAEGLLSHMDDTEYAEYVESIVRGKLLKGFGFHQADEAANVKQMAEAVHEARRVAALPLSARRRGAAEKAAQAIGDAEGSKTPFRRAREVLEGHFEGYDASWMDPRLPQSRQRLQRADELLADFLDDPVNGYGRYGEMTRAITNIPYAPGPLRAARVAASRAAANTAVGKNAIRNIQHLSSALPRLVADIEGDLGLFVEQYARRANVYTPDEVAALRKAADALGGRGTFNKLRKGAREKAFIKFMTDLGDEVALRIFKERGIIHEKMFEKVKGKWYIRGWEWEGERIGFDNLAAAERAVLENVWKKVGWSLRDGQMGLNSHLFGIQKETLEAGLREGDDIITIVARGKKFTVGGKSYDTLDAAKEAARKLGKKGRNAAQMEIRVQAALFETQLPNLWAMFDPYRLRGLVDEAVGYGQKTRSIIQKHLKGTVSEATLHNITGKRVRDAILLDLGDRLVRLWKIGAVATPRYMLRVPMGDEQLRQMADLSFFGWLATKRLTAKLASAGDEIVMVPVHVGGFELQGALARAGLTLDEAMDLKKAQRMSVLADADAKKLERLPNWVHDVIDQTIDGVETKVSNPVWDEAFGVLLKGEGAEPGILLKSNQARKWDGLDPEERLILEKLGVSQRDWDGHIAPVHNRTFAYLDAAAKQHGDIATRGYDPANDIDAIFSQADPKQVQYAVLRWLAEQTESGNMPRSLATTYSTSFNYLIESVRSTGLEKGDATLDNLMNFVRSMFKDQGIESENAEVFYRLLGYSEDEANGMLRNMREMTGYLADPKSNLQPESVALLTKFDTEHVEQILHDAMYKARAEDNFTHSPFDLDAEVLKGRKKWDKNANEALRDLKLMGRLGEAAGLTGRERIDRFLNAVDRIMYYLDGDTSFQSKYARLEDAFRGSVEDIPTPSEAAALDEVEEVAEPITQFRGEHAIFSNFARTTVVYDGVTYPTAEHAFQAAKSADPEVRRAFAENPALKTPTAAKKHGRRIEIREDWEEVKLDVMREIIQSKFRQGSPAADALMRTRGDLIEGNSWGDKFWGVDLKTGKGENNLGKLLMEQREALKKDRLIRPQLFDDVEDTPETILDYEYAPIEAYDNVEPAGMDEEDALGVPYAVAGEFGDAPRLVDGSIDPDAAADLPRIPSYMRNLVDPSLPDGHVVMIGQGDEFATIVRVKARDIKLTQRVSHTGAATIDEVRGIPQNLRHLLGTMVDSDGNVRLVDGHHTLFANLLDANPHVGDALVKARTKLVGGEDAVRRILAGENNFLDANPDQMLETTAKIQKWAEKSPVNENKPRNLADGIHTVPSGEKTVTLAYFKDGKVVSHLTVNRQGGMAILWTSPSVRRQGFGGQLLESFIQRSDMLNDPAKLDEFVSNQYFTPEGLAAFRSALLTRLAATSDVEMRILAKPDEVLLQGGRYISGGQELGPASPMQKFLNPVKSETVGPTIHPGHALVVGADQPLPRLEQFRDVKVVLISGSRKGKNFKPAITDDLEKLAAYYDNQGIPKPVIMHGANGDVDMWAASEAKRLGFPVEASPVVWDNPGGIGVSMHSPDFDKPMVGGQTLRKQYEARVRWKDSTKAARQKVGRAKGAITRYKHDNPGDSIPASLKMNLKTAETELASFGPDPAPHMRFVEGADLEPGPISYKWSEEELADFWHRYRMRLYGKASRLSTEGHPVQREVFRNSLLELRGKYLVSHHKVGRHDKRFNPVPHINAVLAQLNKEENIFKMTKTLIAKAGMNPASIRVEEILALAQKAHDASSLSYGLQHIEWQYLTDVERNIYDAIAASGASRANYNKAKALLDKHGIRSVSPEYIAKHGYADKNVMIPAQDAGRRLMKAFEDKDNWKFTKIHSFSGAGIERNLRMFGEGSPGMTLAYWDGASPGTRHAIAQSKHSGTPAIVRSIPGQENQSIVKFANMKASQIAEERGNRLQVFGFYDANTGTIKINMEAFKSEDWRTMPFLLQAGARFDEVGNLRHFRPMTLVTWHEEGHAFFLRMSQRHRARWEKALKAFANDNPDVLAYDAGEVFSDAYMLWRADPETLKAISPDIHDVFARQPKAMKATEEMVRRDVKVEQVYKNTSKAGHGQSTDPDDLQMAWNIRQRTGMDPDELKVNSASPTEFTSAIIHEKNQARGILDNRPAMDVDRLKWESLDPVEMTKRAAQKGANKEQIAAELQTFFLPQWHRALVHWHSYSAIGQEVLEAMSAGYQYDEIVGMVNRMLVRNEGGIAARLNLRTPEEILEHSKLAVSEIWKVTLGGDREIAGTALRDPEALLGLLSNKVASLPPEKLPIINGQMAEQIEGAGPGFLKAIADKYTDTLFARATNKFSRQPYYKMKRAQHEQALLGMVLENGEGMTPQTMRAIKMSAREQAIQDTWELLFDARRQNRLSEMVRFFMPFAQPWAEALVVWSRLLQKNPAYFLHLYQGGRTLKEHGVVKQDRNGEWVVKVPFVGDLMATIGNFLLPGTIKQDNDHFNLVFPLQSFNFMLASTVNIGGIPVPAPSMWAPATYLTQKLSESDALPEGLRSALAQYAYQYGSVQGGGNFTRALLPTWLANTLSALGAMGSQKELYTQDFLILMESHGVTGVSLFEDRELAMNLSGQVFNTVEEANAWLIREAETKATSFGLMRTFFGTVFPAPPILEFPYYEAQVRFDELKEKYPDDWDKVRDTFIEEYPDLKMLTVAATMWSRGDISPVSLPPNAAVRALFETDAADQLMAINPQFLFALLPEEAWDSEFDRVEWMRQIDSGWRRVKTPEEFIASYETSEGWRHFFWAVEQRDSARAALEAQGINSNNPQWAAVDEDFSNVVDYIRRLFPAFGNDFVPGQEKPATVIKNISQALDIPEFANTKIGEGLTRYFEERTEFEKELEVNNISSINNDVAETLGIRGEYEDMVESLKLEYGEGFTIFFDKFLSSDLTDQYLITKGEQVLHNLSQNEETWARVTQEQATWNELIEKTDTWEPGIDPEKPAIALLYQDQRNMSNRWWKEYGNTIENPQYSWWETMSYSEKQDYILSIASRPFQYLSRFDKEVILGLDTYDWSEEAWGEVNYLSAFAAVANEDNPAGRDAGFWYKRADGAAADFALETTDFARELDLANTWGYVFFKATGYGNRESASDPAWQSVQKLLQQKQAFADAWRMGDDNNYDEYLRRLYIGLRTDLLSQMEALAETNPTFAAEYEEMKSNYPQFINVLIPESYYRLG